jgi:pimeloyl-ACP methyl ester carboxylesterase
MLGHGESQKPDLWEAYSTEEFIKDFHAIYMMYRAPAGQKNVIVSHSYGVSVCVEWYAEMVALSKDPVGVSAWVLLGAALAAPGGSRRKRDK